MLRCRRDRYICAAPSATTLSLVSAWPGSGPAEADPQITRPICRSVVAITNPFASEIATGGSGDTSRQAVEHEVGAALETTSFPPVAIAAVRIEKKPFVVRFRANWPKSGLAGSPVGGQIWPQP